MIAPAPTTVAIYCRSARPDGGIAIQRQLCRRGLAADPQRWAVAVHRYDDAGRPGTTLDRPALQRLLADLRQGVVGAVAVTTLDRLARRLPDLDAILAACQAAGAPVLTVSAQGVMQLPLARLRAGLVLLGVRP